MKKYVYQYILPCIMICGVLLMGGSSTYAGWFTFGSEEIKAPVCKEGSACSLSGGASVVKKVVGTNLTSKPVSEYIQDIVVYFLGFLSIVAVIYIIYAGFQIFIGGGDEEKVKKAKQIITHIILGLVLIWLAYSIVIWIFSIFA